MRLSNTFSLILLLPLTTNGAVVLSNFDYRPGINFTPTVAGDFGDFKQALIQPTYWEAARFKTGSVSEPGQVFVIDEIQIYIPGVLGANPDGWGISLALRGTGFGPFDDPDVDTPNTASGPVLGTLSTPSLNFGDKGLNPTYETLNGTSANSFRFHPEGRIELQPDTVYWLAAMTDAPGDSIRWQYATVDGTAVTAYTGADGWEMFATTSLNYDGIHDPDTWHTGVDAEIFAQPLLYEIHATVADATVVPEPSTAAALAGGLGALFLFFRRRS